MDISPAGQLNQFVPSPVGNVVLDEFMCELPRNSIWTGTEGLMLRSLGLGANFALCLHEQVEEAGVHGAPTWE